MAPFPDEVDVFTAPHWRMKQLVGGYCEKLSKTNFSNNNDFRALLQSLYETFEEFKMHEQIENEYIIGLLQQRSQTVYNVHSDNKLSEMLMLFEKGLKNVKNEYEQLNYAQQLKERLEAFTSDFLPHMKEEEEVFQPMLMEYFTYDELKDIKKKVIAQHCSQNDTAELLRGLSLWNQAEELQKVLKYSVDEKVEQETKVQQSTTSISHLPPEVMLNVFSYLNPQELCRCIQVNTKWAQLAKTGSLWKHLYPVLWARGDWYNGPPTQLDTEPDEEWVSRRHVESQAYQEWDEDADIDESEEAEQDKSHINMAQREKELLQGLMHSILPNAGHSVKTLVLAYSSATSSKMVRKMLEFCPNLEHLDLTQTDISDSAFDGWSFGSCQNLQHVDLSGCEKITDLTLERISHALGMLPSYRKKLQKCCQNLKNMKSSWGGKEIANSIRCSMAGESGLFSVALWPEPNKSESYASSQIWILDSDKLADIEDAADWKYRNTGGLCVLDLNCFSAGCCSSRPMLGVRTNVSWQQRCRSAGFTYCGHSFCSGSGKLRTIQALPGSSALCKIGKRTTRSEITDFCPGSANSDLVTRGVRFLSLSGCRQITDNGLRMLTLWGGLPYLEHLNLSGCLIVTGPGLQDLVSACPSLNDEHFYYCDNINGPHADTASGCQNLQCGFRACCRSGE
ncbi:F-box/LRR-repeat protein 5 [Spea bombifrons]|uniref:F-box/LRR-repeat protein 5 n=1 Tax=Spea bombifrons TaxID=233779 RepID=UPI00234B41E6|nr:F-box/LRR-repeat protein 5 [Spea bombifrons]